MFMFMFQPPKISGVRVYDAHTGRDEVILDVDLL